VTRAVKKNEKKEKIHWLSGRWRRRRSRMTYRVFDEEEEEEG